MAVVERRTLESLHASFGESRPGQPKAVGSAFTDALPSPLNCWKIWSGHNNCNSSTRMSLWRILRGTFPKRRPRIGGTRACIKCLVVERRGPLSQTSLCYYPNRKSADPGTVVSSDRFRLLLRDDNFLTGLICYDHGLTSLP